MCISHLRVTPHTHTVLMIRHSSVTEKCRRPRPDQTARLLMDQLQLSCVLLLLEPPWPRAKALIWMYLTHWRDDRCKCRFKEEKGAQSSSVPPLLWWARPLVFIVCWDAVNSLHFSNIGTTGSWLSSNLRPTDANVFTVSSLLYKYWLTAKFQMLIREARVKLCDFEKQEAGSAGCFGFVCARPHRISE